MAIPIFTTKSPKQEAAIRRAIISVVPDYFAWTDEVQERYRANMPDDDHFRIQQVLIKALLGIKTATRDELETALDSFKKMKVIISDAAAKDLL